MNLFQTDLGNRLLPCFNSPSGIPYSDVNLGTAIAHSPRWSPDSSTSEVTTVQLEFRDLAWLTKNQTYERVHTNLFTNPAENIPTLVGMMTLTGGYNLNV